MKASIPPWVSRHQRGIGLVEIMVALTLGLVLMGGVLQVFLSNKQTYRMQEAHARLQENGRFAMEKISRDIREAGYWGCASRSVSASLKNTLNPLADFRAYFYKFNTVVEGFEWTGSGWTPSIDANVFPNARNQNDIITLRAPLGRNIRVTAPYMISKTDDPPISANNELRQDDIVMVSDCTSATIMQVTNPDDTPPITAGSLQHDVVAPGAPPGPPGNSTKDLDAIYLNDSEVIKISTVSYYIRDGASGLPGLYRREGDAAPEELIEGVENMQIRYGEDTNNDKSANRYLRANLIGDWANVVSVRVNLLLMTLDDNLTAAPQTFRFNGQTFPASRRLRRVFKTTVGIRNRLAN
jgi:type IV pilus assembly protein PilW